VRWLSGPHDAVKTFISRNEGSVAEDRYGSPVYLARSAWEANYAEQKNPDVKFLKTRERA
jgi:peptide chain release factor 3